MSMCYYNLVKNYKKAIMNSQHIRSYFVPITQFYLLVFNNSDIQIERVTKVGTAKLTNTYLKAKNITYYFLLYLFFPSVLLEEEKNRERQNNLIIL